ncbi:hypothetical protein BU24DRAFT_226084 [Aaosphaeria arxii CBS 175.79]|uniref:dual-specificity kinase n=1 Tax=Aaosphaeria arxii CBS 175.79 TaxID=1450172 RepID=A0A6A5XQ01_9PLEO|nr:uncharacterized protein BU24DRAFT_226084 [Aaosphaeria arxii CBS 175.79]KAF2014979.1 hypothetical protein BU24DRAFT_226084 [Aaosphaeria arxii CBS 175.79]
MESGLPIPRNNSAEDSSGSAEGRVRRKFQRTTSGSDNKLRKPSGSNMTSAPRPPPPPQQQPPPPPADNKSNFRGRRQSLREPHKVPLGPRPLDMSKPRVTSDASVASSTANRSFLPTSTSESTFTSSVRTSNPRFSFGKQSQSETPKDFTDSTGSYDFLPSVNFDDFHASISAYEPDLSDFPAPGGGGVGLFDSNKTSLPITQPATHANMASDIFTPGTGTEQRPARSSSLMRRFSQSRKPSDPIPALPTTNLPTMPPPATNMSIRTRRQSQFPTQAPPNPAARAPRKSVGPGMLPSGFDSTRHDVPKVSTESTQGRLGRTPSLSGGRRSTVSANVNTTGEPPKLPIATRSIKAKSLHAPPRQQSGFLSTSSMTPEHSMSSSLAHARSPGKPSAAHRTQTPSSTSSKRQSTMHHHGGLGARTISPTDARRLKRMSMNPNQPGGPTSPPTPQAEFSFDDRALEQSPALIFRKSVTPSSARGTPDQNQNRKSYASGISLSSNSSVNSLRLGNSSLQPRNPALAGSRLPTPKPRNLHSSAATEEEEVPPVPAIPKAYESPKDPDHSYFSFSAPGVKSALPTPPAQDVKAPGDTISTELQNIEALGIDPSKTDPPRKNNATIRHRRGLTVGSGSTDVEKTPSVPHTNKKNLQPIRLPPLNLLPLGTPFNNRMSSFTLPSTGGDERTTTPPPKRGNKTPSTPMTASKASFFSRSNNSEHYDMNKHLRSSSSAINLRPSDSETEHSSAMPIPTLNPTRQTTTPFASNSLPKGSGEFVRMYSRPSGEYSHMETGMEMQNMKVNGPRPLPKAGMATPSAHDHSMEAEPSTPNTSLRRKLSLGGWRRASSKTASHPSHSSHAPSASQKNDEQQHQPPQVPKHNEMPPPKLPASATWSGAIGANSPTPSNRTRPSLDSGRRKTSTTTIGSDAELDKLSIHKTNSGPAARAHSSANEQANIPTPKSSSSSILTPMQRMLGSKSSSNVLKARHLDPNLDRDDLLADEEMRKLASKRKDFESAARDVDELRKRARPQERVTPAQAIQMVNLNIFERGEIIDYKEIYFCGTKNAKKHVGDLNQQTLNFGYDDDRGDYNIVLGDHLAYRYEVVDVLGKGSFGQVVRCVDHKTGLLVAIKIIRNKKRFHQQALVEVNILQKLREWDPDNKHSMINFTQSFYFRGHLCISTELLGMNLYEFIKAHEFKGFSLRLIRRFTKQMLSSLVLLRSRRVIHCDLKPENILLAHPLHSELKVIDFGSSCFENEKVYTYIQSRFYRSPEVILGMSYGLPIDMWSLGCILAELLTGYPIFPGENEQEQLACIMEIFGPPEKHLIEKSSRKKLFFDSLGKPRVTVSSKGRRRRPSSKTLQQALKCDDDAFLDFIARCLRWDPERRMKPEEAQLHEFVTGMRKTGRGRAPMNGASGFSSPMKRLPPTASSQQRVRPLPEPPGTNFKNGVGPGSSQVPSSSPVKIGGPRRHSTVQGGPAATGVKRTANGAPLNVTSGLPRVAQRSASGKPDLASAAAIASLKSR